MSLGYKKNNFTFKKVDLIPVILRSFLFQGSWNFKKMQNLGFAFSIFPAICKIYPDKQERQIALERHLEFYNSHPYMASFVLGAVIRLEEKHAQGEDVQIEDIVLLKKTMMGPMGALGDTFFWVSLRPALGVFSTGLALLGFGISPFIFLFFYNIPHFYTRIFGLYQGYVYDKDVVEKIGRYNIYQYSLHLKALMLIILGAMIPVVIKFKGYDLSKNLNISINVIIFLAIVVIAEIFHRKVSVNKLLAVISSICILLGLLKII